MDILIIVALVVLAALGLMRWNFSRSEPAFLIRASEALDELGLDIDRLPSAAKDRFFAEGHAIYTATNSRITDRYNPKRFAMVFWGWYCTDNPMVDRKAFIREGVLAQSIPVMRGWAKKDSTLCETAEREVTRIFQFLYRGFEAQGSPEAMEAQLALLEIMGAKGKQPDVRFPPIADIEPPLPVD